MKKERHTATQLINDIVIIGGGTAGWLSAGLIAAKRSNYVQSANLTVTLIESPTIKTIGVGEGTWPSMRSTLQQIGIDETEFITTCNVSLKQGSKFVGWRDGTLSDSYYHPFVTPTGYYQHDLYANWKTIAPNVSFADFVSAQSVVCDAQKSPKQFATPDYASVLNYGYHLDAGKFAELLKYHCINKLKVRFICDDVTHIQNNDNGDITSVQTNSSGHLKGDFFIDCSGMHGLLIDKHFKTSIKKCDDVLFNNTAIATHLHCAKGAQDIASATVATAQEAGWTWDIALQNRRGIGYTFSNKHSNDDAAAAVLRRYITLQADAKTARDCEFKKISFTPGYREKFWVNNCLAIGMSAGFFEPLEASALAMVELSLTMLTDEFPSDRQHMDILQKRFNKRFEYRWQRVVDFLKLHYVFNQRNEAYWHDAKALETVPDSLQDLIQLWHYQPPNRHDLNQNEEVFPSASYQYVLYGLGFEPIQHKVLDQQQLTNAQALWQQNIERQQRYLQGLPTNRALVEHLRIR